MRRIYSLNKIAFLISADANVELRIDNANKVYAIVDEDILSLLEEYNNNKQLHKFLNAYKIIKEYIKNNK